MRTINDIKKVIKDKNYKLFDKGDYNLNLVFERTNDTYTNYFTDILHILYKVNGKDVLLSLPCTTKPGIKGSTDTPITYKDVTGTAVIIPDQYSRSFRFIDSYEEFSKYPYLRLIDNAKLKYWRDGDRDTTIDKNEEYLDNFHTHIHVMSNKGVIGKPINNWSLGCMGLEEPNMLKLNSLLRLSSALYGNIFTVTVLESKDFNN